jgi:hypothetical protein
VLHRILLLLQDLVSYAASRAVGLSVHLVDCFCFPSSSSSNCLLTNMPPALVSYSCLSCMCQWCLCFLCFLLTLVGVCNDLTGTKSWRQSTRKSCERRRERGLGRRDLSPPDQGRRVFIDTNVGVAEERLLNTIAAWWKAQRDRATLRSTDSWLFADHPRKQ